jgi:biotin carboxylase
MSDKRTLVVGTTADYVDLIRTSYPDRALFVSHSSAVQEEKNLLWNRDELLCDLTDSLQVCERLSHHLECTGITPSGIACFDCESLGLAAYLAEKLGLPFPSREAVAACRNKYVERKMWCKADVDCPKAELVHCSDDLLRFFSKQKKQIILKPLSGTGSELVFRCSSREDCIRAYSTIQSRMRDHEDQRLYPTAHDDSPALSPRRVFMAEEFADGIEYSCDFVLDGDRADIIRIAKKLHSPRQVFGTTWAYIVPASLPTSINYESFVEQAKRAARALSLDRAICMLDFMVVDNRTVFLELSPRPGGDCLPDLLLHAGRFDIIAFTLNFADGLPYSISDFRKWSTRVGLRLFAEREGKISKISQHHISMDSRVRSVRLRHGAGHRVVLPPYDYDSRILGHVIFRPNDYSTIPYECHDISAKLKIEMEEETCRVPRAS